MSFFGWNETPELKVNVTKPREFQQEMCKLAPEEQAKMLQEMGRADNKNSKLPPVTFAADGALVFPGQLAINTPGDAHGNTYRLLEPNIVRTVSIIDAHQNKLFIGCGAKGSPTDSGDTPVPETPKTGSPSEWPTVSLPSLKPNASQAENSTKIDIGLPDGLHVLIEQSGTSPPKINAPSEAKVMPSKDGGLDITFGGRTLHEHNGGLSGDDISGVTIKTIVGASQSQ